jgi:hypothetical protein
MGFAGVRSLALDPLENLFPKHRNVLRRSPLRRVGSYGLPALALLPVAARPGAFSRAIALRRRGSAQLAIVVDGQAGLGFAPGGRPFVVFDFVAENARILEISLIADARRIKGT